jgi:hypothetical protein
MIKQINHYTSGIVARAFLSMVLLANLAPAYDASAADEQQEELKEYDVELIIFEDAHARYMYSESWEPKSDEMAKEMPEDAIHGSAIKGDAIQGKQIQQQAPPVSEQERDFTPLPVGMLNREYKRLSLSSEVKVLYRTAWRQPGLDEKKAFSINLDELKNAHKSNSNNSISGTVRLELSRFLHLYAELDYHRPVVTEELPTEQASAAITDFKFNAYRKMRSKELHYIDHPLVGILVKIMPVEKPEEAQASDSSQT